MATAKRTHVRYLIVAMLFVASSFSYGDRVALSIAGTAMQHELALDPVKLGFLLSGFSWAYVAGQLPSGGLLDRFGSKRVYGISIIGWSICAFLTGFAGYVIPSLAFSSIFVLRLASGLAQSPVFPGNGRIVAAWFPATERGRASAIFNSSQYFAVVLFSPAMALIMRYWGWRYCFYCLGLVGLLLAILWRRTIFSVRSHPRMSDS